MAELTEEDVRRIIREELKSLLGSLATTANDLDVPYETGELESSALMAIEKVAKHEANRMPHGWKCAKRIDYWNKICNCGIGEEDENDG